MCGLAKLAEEAIRLDPQLCKCILRARRDNHDGCYARNQQIA